MYPARASSSRSRSEIWFTGSCLPTVAVVVHEVDLLRDLDLLIVRVPRVRLGHRAVGAVRAGAGRAALREVLHAAVVAAGHGVEAGPLARAADVGVALELAEVLLRGRKVELDAGCRGGSSDRGRGGDGERTDHF